MTVRLLSIVACAGLALWLALGVAAPPSGDAVKAFPEVERRVFELTNEERERRGLAPLEREATLAAAGREHSSDMLRRYYFNHVAPGGETPADRIHRADRRLVGTTGENIWMGGGYDPSDAMGVARAIMSSWMNSAGHRENILGDFTHLGVGVVAEGREIRATQAFARARGWLRHPLPEVVDRYDPVILTVKSHNGKQASAEQIELVTRDSKKVLGPVPLGQPVRLDASPGEYETRFLFPAGGFRYAVYPGPTVRIR